MDEDSLSLISIEQKESQTSRNNLINVESNHLERKSFIKSSYQIPNPTIFLPHQLPSSSKPINNPNMIILNQTPQSSLILTTHQTNSFYLKRNSIDAKEDSSTISINSVQITDHEGLIIQKSPVISSNRSTNLSPVEILPQIKVHQETKSESESLWKTKLTLKTLLAMANRDEAQALKNRKPIDYHMFLTNKFMKNSLLQYEDFIDKKFTVNNPIALDQQDYHENRRLYKRLLNTMGLRKPLNAQKSRSMTSIKQTKRKHSNRTSRKARIQKNVFSSVDNSEKPVLIHYQAIPISK